MNQCLLKVNVSSYYEFSGGTLEKEARVPLHWEGNEPNSWGSSSMLHSPALSVELS